MTVSVFVFIESCPKGKQASSHLLNVTCANTTTNTTTTAAATAATAVATATALWPYNNKQTRLKKVLYKKAALKKQVVVFLEKAFLITTPKTCFNGSPLFCAIWKAYFLRKRSFLQNPMVFFLCTPCCFRKKPMVLVLKPHSFYKNRMALCNKNPVCIKHSALQNARFYKELYS